MSVAETLTATAAPWLDANPGHELWEEMRTELETAALDHVRFQRTYLGWGVFALMRR